MYFKQWFQSIIRSRLKRPQTESYHDKWKNNYFKKELKI